MENFESVLVAGSAEAPQKCEEKGRVAADENDQTSGRKKRREIGEVKFVGWSADATDRRK